VVGAGGEVESDSANVYVTESMDSSSWHGDGTHSATWAFFDICVDLGVTPAVELLAWGYLGVLTGPDEGGVTLTAVSV
jgi:hypothetical protein